MFGGSTQFPTTVEYRCAQRFDYRELGSKRKMGGAADDLIDGNEKRICQLGFEFYRPHVSERHVTYLDPGVYFQ